MPGLCRGLHWHARRYQPRLTTIEASGPLKWPDKLSAVEIIVDHIYLMPLPLTLSESIGHAFGVQVDNHDNHHRVRNFDSYSNSGQESVRTRAWDALWDDGQLEGTRTVRGRDFPWGLYGYLFRTASLKHSGRNPGRGQYYSTKSRYCNRKRDSRRSTRTSTN